MMSSGWKPLSGLVFGRFLGLSRVGPEMTVTNLRQETMTS